MGKLSTRSPFKTPSKIITTKPVSFWLHRAVCHQAAKLDIFAPRIHRGDTKSFGKRDELGTVEIKERVRAINESPALISRSL